MGSMTQQHPSYAVAFYADGRTFVGRRYSHAARRARCFRGDAVVGIGPGAEVHRPILGYPTVDILAVSRAAT